MLRKHDFSAAILLWPGVIEALKDRWWDLIAFVR